MLWRGSPLGVCRLQWRQISAMAAVSVLSWFSRTGGGPLQWQVAPSCCDLAAMAAVVCGCACLLVSVFGFNGGQLCSAMPGSASSLFECIGGSPLQWRGSPFLLRFRLQWRQSSAMAGASLFLCSGCNGCSPLQCRGFHLVVFRLQWRQTSAMAWGLPSCCDQATMAAVLCNGGGHTPVVIWLQ